MPLTTDKRITATVTAQAPVVTATVITPDPKTGAAPPKFVRPNFERMAPELKLLKNWVLWGAIWTGSKWTKRPIQVSGFGASTTNPKHWSSFDDVKQAYERAIQRGYIELREKGKPIQQIFVGGVGFVFDGRLDEDGLVLAGVDFDGVIPREGEISSFAVERVKRIGSYVEKSVSGTGLHVILKAHPLAGGIAHNGIELYTGGRFFTMTGHAPDNARIIAAPVTFAALAEELQAQIKSSHSGDGDLSTAPLFQNGEETADAEANAWFGKLPPEKQSEVVKYAALHIAKNSKLFELTGNGGNYQEYLKLAFSLARSGVAAAEDIFIEAASTAKDADTDEALRSFFKKCEDAQAPTNGITVGTLFYNAIQCGADFSPWKQIADVSCPEVLFVPGNEEECRKLLDCVAAADPRTYTLGDPTGPLVILRVPDKTALPSNTRWEGDLPGTTLATSADIMQRAERIRWMKEGRFGRYRIRPPRDFINDYLMQMLGQYGARPLRSIVRVPSIDDDGEIYVVPGYDPQTWLFHDKSPTFDVQPNPSHDVARRAATEVLLFPFSKYQFDNPAAGQALLLAAIFTAIERPFLPVAPMFVVRSSMPGTGKGKIVRGLVRLAFDTVPVVITWGGSSEEFEKRLAALLLRTPGVLSIDNANGMQIKGDLLESIITEGRADIRPLGYSKIVKVRNRSLITLTGNNPIITGDMARRALSIEIVPRSADPERDCYPFDPAEIIQRRRTDLLMAAFIAMRAFRLAGMPRQGLPAVGSFDDWSHRVRDLVYWLTGYDVSEGFRQNKAEDPRRQADATLLSALHQHFGTKPFKAADVIAIHKKVVDQKCSWAVSAPTPTEQALHEALEDVLGRDVNAKLLGHVARRLNGAHNGGFILETHHNPATNANDITVRRMQQGLPPGSTGITGSTGSI